MDMIQRGYVIVDANRGRDDTASRDSFTHPYQTMHAAFAQVQDNDTVLVYPGLYTETPTYDTNWPSLPLGGAAFGLVQKKNVTIEGIGWPEVHFNAHANGMAFVNCANCRMTRIKVSGLGYMRAGPSHYYALVLLHGVNRGLQFDNIEGADSGDHILAHLAGPRTVFDTRVTNSRFYRCGQMIPSAPWPDGVAVGLGGYGNTIAGNYFEECNRCVEIESGDFPNDTVEAINISVVDNKIYHPWAHPILITPLNAARVYGKMIISRNTIQGWGRDPKPDFGGHWAPNGIWVTGGQNVLISENIISDLWDASAIIIQAAGAAIRNVVVVNNVMTNIGRCAVSMTVEDWKSQGKLPENYPLEFCQVSHNQVKDCHGRAFWIGGNYGLIESNVAVNGDYAGLYEVPGSKGNMFRQNRVFDSGGATVPGQPPDKAMILQNGEQYVLNEAIYINKPGPTK